MRLLIILMFALSGFPIDLLAYPISARPLRQLVMESRYIIVGYVARTYNKSGNEEDWGSRVAKIAVIENLKGKIV